MMKIKDIPNALSSFEQAAIAHEEATFRGDYKAVNKNYSIIQKSIKFLKQHSKIELLMDFLPHSSSGVPSWAATYLLPIREAEAISVLEELIKRLDIRSLDAKTTLQEWKKGNLKVLPKYDLAFSCSLSLCLLLSLLLPINIFALPKPITRQWQMRK